MILGRTLDGLIPSNPPPPPIRAGVSGGVRRSGRKASWALDVTTIAAALAFAIAVFDLPLSSYLRDLNIDDSFYYYQIARNFSHGVFSSFDGVNLTNGYHPLWPLMLTPVFAVVPDPVLALRVAKMVELAMLLAAGLLMASSGRKAGWSPVVAMAVPVWLFGTPALYGGMETSVQVVLFAALMSTLLRLFSRADNSSYIQVALLCCLLPWARLESLAASLSTMAAISVRANGWDRRHLRAVGVGWALLGLSVAAYFLYNSVIFGSAVPISGAIKNYWSSTRFASTGGYSLGDSFRNYQRLHWPQVLLSAALVATALASWALPRYRTREMATSHALDVFLAVLVVAYGSRLIYSVAFVHYTYDNLYYYIPYLVLRAMAVPYVLSRALLLGSLVRPGLRATGPAAAAAGALAVLGVAWLAHPWSLPAQWRRERRSPDWQEASFDGAVWMNRHLPAGAVVGSPDCGVVGYFSNHRVVNLDGLVNSAAFFRAMRTQSVETWIRAAGVTHLANGVRVDGTSGCAFIAAGSAQTKPYSGCRLVHEGVRFHQPWLRKLDDMQFRVYAFGAKAPE